MYHGSTSEKSTLPLALRHLPDHTRGQNPKYNFWLIGAYHTAAYLQKFPGTYKGKRTHSRPSTHEGNNETVHMFHDTTASRSKKQQTFRSQTVIGT